MPNRYSHFHSQFPVVHPFCHKQNDLSYVQIWSLLCSNTVIALYLLSTELSTNLAFKTLHNLAQPCLLSLISFYASPHNSYSSQTGQHSALQMYSAFIPRLALILKKFLPPHHPLLSTNSNTTAS